MEACGAAYYWARELRALGHHAVLPPPQYVKMVSGERLSRKGRRPAAGGPGAAVKGANNSASVLARDAEGRNLQAKEDIARSVEPGQARHSEVLTGRKCRVRVWNSLAAQPILASDPAVLGPQSTMLNEERKHFITGLDKVPPPADVIALHPALRNNSHELKKGSPKALWQATPNP